MLWWMRKTCAITTFGVLTSQRRCASLMMSSNTGIMMILSPAKTLDLTPFQHVLLGEGVGLTLPDCDLSKTEQLAKDMKSRKESEIGKLLGISANLAATATGYWKDFMVKEKGSDEKKTFCKPCIYAFSGAAYQGLQIQECDQDAVAYLQRCLRIIDPLYGSLRPMDQIQPYRLEMATKGALKDKKKVKLADFWSNSVTQHISKDLQSFEDPILLNLASDEYSAAINAAELPKKAKFVKVVFRESGRVVAVHAKRARGLMVRFVAEKQAKTLDDIKTFAEEGYSYQPDESIEGVLVFDREKQAKKAPPSKRKKAAPAKSSAKKKSKR